MSIKVLSKQGAYAKLLSDWRIGFMIVKNFLHTKKKLWLMYCFEPLEALSLDSFILHVHVENGVKYFRTFLPRFRLRVICALTFHGMQTL